MPQINSFTTKAYLIASAVFSVVIKGFAEATTFIFSTNNNIVITYLLKTLQKIVQTIRAGKNNIVYRVKLTTKLVNTLINAKTNKIIYVFSEIGKIYSIINFETNIVAIIKQKLRFLFTLRVPKTIITALPIVAYFIQLSVYDPQTIGSMDASQLGTLDYIET